MNLLEVKNLHVEVDGRKILNGLELSVGRGSVHALMGPNGSGKSTLAHVLAGKEGYVVTQGEVLLDGEDILALPPDERAARGLFLAFQYPFEIPGVATMTFLRTALNAQRKKRGEAEISTPEFLKHVRAVAGKLGIEQEMLRRGVNVGFSGGRRSATRSCRWRCCNRGCACSTRRIPVSISTRSKPSPTGSMGCARLSARSW